MSATSVFLLLEGLSFLVAAVVHSGALFDHRDPGAAIAETVIGTVLLAGFALTRIRPLQTRTFGLAAQGVALLGTLIGTYLTAIVGLGTPLDVAYHVTILYVLVAGLFTAAWPVRRRVFG